jgi:putative oxidoreductase
MVASIFILQGYDTFRRPERVAPRAEPVVRQLSDRIPAVPAKTEDAVRLNGAVQMVAGTLLALGWFPRPAALALAGTLVPTTAAGHRFWEAEEDADRAQQRIHFLKNLSMFGGLLIAAVDTGGRPSIAWRARHSVQEARREARLVARTARASAKAGARAGKASAKAARVRAEAGKAGARAGRAGARAGRAGRAGVRAGQLRGRAGALSR